jgi:50S ribosomal subunit-associated GTPase HflX
MHPITKPSPVLDVTHQVLMEEHGIRLTEVALVRHDERTGPVFVGVEESVLEVVHELDAHRTRSVVVFNKIDLIDEAERALLRRRYPDAVLVSSATGEAAHDLLARLAEEAALGSRTMTLLVPYTRGEIVRAAHERAQIVSEHHTEQGTQLVVRAPADTIALFEPFTLDGTAHPHEADTES